MFQRIENEWKRHWHQLSLPGSSKYQWNPRILSSYPIVFEIIFSTKNSDIVNLGRKKCASENFSFLHIFQIILYEWNGHWAQLNFAFIIKISVKSTHVEQLPKLLKITTYMSPLASQWYCPLGPAFFPTGPFPSYREILDLFTLRGDIIIG